MCVIFTIYVDLTSEFGFRGNLYYEAKFTVKKYE